MYDVAGPSACLLPQGGGGRQGTGHGERTTHACPAPSSAYPVGKIGPHACWRGRCLVRAAFVDFAITRASFSGWLTSWMGCRVLQRALVSSRMLALGGESTPYTSMPVVSLTCSLPPLTRSLTHSLRTYATTQQANRPTELPTASSPLSLVFSPRLAPGGKTLAQAPRRHTTSHASPRPSDHGTWVRSL
jgi:hypothetical protein